MKDLCGKFRKTGSSKHEEEIKCAYIYISAVDLIELDGLYRG